MSILGAWTGKPCTDCSKKKSPTRVDKMRCTTCERAVKNARADLAWDGYLRETYGITADLYWELYDFQNGMCYLCQHAFGKSRHLSVDHDHKCCKSSKSCGKCVRGLLCQNCNRNVLGRAARDDPAYFERGLLYLLAPPFQIMQGMLREDQ